MYSLGKPRLYNLAPESSFFFFFTSCFHEFIAEHGSVEFRTELLLAFKIKP